MAKLPDEILTNIFSLQRQLAEGIGEISALEWLLFEQYGETEETIGELEELQNAKERLIVPYSRLHTLLLRVFEAQPVPSTAMLDLLAQTIEQGQATIDASKASVREIKENWDLL